MLKNFVLFCGDNLLILEAARANCRDLEKNKTIYRF